MVDAGKTVTFFCGETISFASSSLQTAVIATHDVTKLEFLTQLLV